MVFKEKKETEIQVGRKGKAARVSVMNTGVIPQLYLWPNHSALDRPTQETEEWPNFSSSVKATSVRTS